ncbi:MAG: PH domain-containing protein [Mycoplasmatales bacterium]
MLSKLGLTTKTRIDEQISEFLIHGEEIILIIVSTSEEIVVTNIGLYFVDVIGVNKRKQTVFIPGKYIEAISYQSSSKLEGNTMITLSVKNNPFKSDDNRIDIVVKKGQKENVIELIKIYKEIFLL